MSDAAWVSLAAIVTQIVTAVVLWIKAHDAATSAATAKDAARTTSDKVDEVAKTTETIHQLTNSGMTKVREELKAARAEIRELQQMRVDQALAATSPGTLPKSIEGVPDETLVPNDRHGPNPHQSHQSHEPQRPQPPKPESRP